MVGGIVIEVAEIKGSPNLLYLDILDERQTCGILVEKNKVSDRIEIGDAVWWQGSLAMWTPQKNREKAKQKKQGVDFDVQIRRAGTAGIIHPFRRSLT